VRQAIGVDGRAGIQTPAAVVIAESARGFLYEDRWSGVIRNVTAKPDADIDLALRHAVYDSVRSRTLSTQ
jgi:hypothetical protein